MQMTCMSNTKTKDNVTVTLQTAVQFQISTDAIYEAGEISLSLILPRPCLIPGLT